MSEGIENPTTEDVGRPAALRPLLNGVQSQEQVQLDALIQILEELRSVFEIWIFSTPLKVKTYPLEIQLVRQSPRLNHVVASELILSQVSLPVDDDLEESLNRVDLAPLKSLLPLSQLFPRVEENHLHIVIQAPTNGEPILVFLHVTDNLIDVVRRAWVPKTREKMRGEIGSLRCIKARVLSLLLSLLINNVYQGFKTSSRAF